MSAGYIVDDNGQFKLVVDAEFSAIRMAADGVLGVLDGNPQIVFDNANGWMEFTGDVGIGTASPGKPLDVHGVIRSRNVGGISSPTIEFTDAGGGTTYGKIISPSDSSLRFQPGAVEKVRITSTGNLGLGATIFGTNAAGTMAFLLGTDPTADVADQFAFFAHDFAAGNTCPYFRTENGTIIGLNQSLLDTDNPTFNKFKITAIGGIATKLTNKTGANSIAGYCVTNSDSTADAVRLVPIDEPNPIGVFLESGVSDGSEAWIVIGGIADVYFWATTTLGDMARTGLVADTGEVAGQAMSEASPTSPFNVDKHFCEIGHVLEAREGAGLARCVLHFN